MEIIKLSKIKIMGSLIVKFLNELLDHGSICCLDYKKCGVALGLDRNF